MFVIDESPLQKNNKNFLPKFTKEFSGHLSNRKSWSFLPIRVIWWWKPACWGLNADRWKQQTVWQEPFRWNKVVVLLRGPRSVHPVSQLWLDHGKGMPCHHSEWYSGRREHTSWLRWSITTPNIAVWDDSIPSGDSLPSVVLWKRSVTFPYQRGGGGGWNSEKQTAVRHNFRWRL